MGFWVVLRRYSEWQIHTITNVRWAWGVKITLSLNFAPSFNLKFSSNNKLQYKFFWVSNQHLTDDVLVGTWSFLPCRSTLLSWFLRLSYHSSEIPPPEGLRQESPSHRSSTVVSTAAAIPLINCFHGSGPKMWDFFCSNEHLTDDIVCHAGLSPPLFSPPARDFPRRVTPID